jgi:hypothetical protein
VRGEDFDRDGAIEPRVARAIDFSHSTRAEERDHLIRAESSAGRQGHDIDEVARLYGQLGRHLSPRLKKVTRSREVKRPKFAS